MGFQFLLDETREARQCTRAGVIEEIVNLSEADLKFRAHPQEPHAYRDGVSLPKFRREDDLPFGGNGRFHEREIPSSSQFVKFAGPPTDIGLSLACPSPKPNPR